MIKDQEVDYQEVGPKCNYRHLYKRKTDRNSTQTHLEEKAVGRQNRENFEVSGLEKWSDAATCQEMPVTIDPRIGNRQRIDFPLEPLKRAWPCGYLDCSPVIQIVEFWPLEL